MNDSFNPCGLNGFAFIEFSGPNAKLFQNAFEKMGFQLTNQHKSQPISLYQQGNIKFIINNAGNCQAFEHAKMHGPAACAMGFHVKDAKTAFEYAVKQGATPFRDREHANHNLLAINAIGGSVIYFLDDTTHPFANQWQKNWQDTQAHTLNLMAIDHLTHNVFQGNMDKWAKYYETLFNFREIRYFDIKGKHTGLVSRALCSPCNKIKIPLNESQDNKSQIEEFLEAFNGEGIQHIALTTNDIYTSVGKMRINGVPFLKIPDTYYEMIENRLPWHEESVPELQKHQILIDGEKTPEHGLLLQIFTENTFGPVFFELIQRKGNQGFGEGNFQALFEAMERDQIRRGTLKEC